ncbi:hypothetical protein [Paraliobacillus sp. X-1268]|uniref:hypothetical protein n=1 Tax=Paraliobacillus sp. X-1268 TaxID=2213193 RepID=UPI000E3DE36D|nr:hypothetical protein [Paraliobacillus sp. X-1268]
MKINDIRKMLEEEVEQERLKLNEYVQNLFQHFSSGIAEKEATVELMVEYLQMKIDVLLEQKEIILRDEVIRRNEIK